MRLYRACRYGIAAVGLSALAACGHGASTIPPGPNPSASAAPSANARGTANFRITIPAKTTTASHRTPAYVSPATQSMTVAISGSASSMQTVNLTPTSSGCSSTLATTQCTLTIALAPGTYTAVVTTYDGLNAAGNVLSSGQNVNFTVVAGTTNTVALTLSGIPHAIIVAPQSAGITQVNPTNLRMVGFATQKALIVATDADGNIIVGPGAPTYTVAQASGAPFAITNQTIASPNTFALAVQSQNGSEILAGFTITAAFSDQTCSQTGAVCTATFNVDEHEPTLFIQQNQELDALTPPYGQNVTALSGYGGADTFGNGSMAFDSAGNLYVTDDANYQTDVYAPPYTSDPFQTYPATSAASGGTDLDGVAISPNDTLFIADGSNIDIVPHGGTLTSIANGQQVRHVITDSADDVYALSADGSLTKYSAPAYGSGTVVIQPNNGDTRSEIAMDASRNVFIPEWDRQWADLISGVNHGGPVTHYAPPSYGSGSQLDGDGVTVAVAPDGTLAVGHYSSGVSLYRSPFASALSGTTSPAIYTTAMAFDSVGDLFMVATNAQHYAFLAPPYTGSAVLFNAQSTYPSDIAVGP